MTEFLGNLFVILRYLVLKFLVMAMAMASMCFVALALHMWLEIEFATAVALVALCSSIETRLRTDKDGEK